MSFDIVKFLGGFAFWKGAVAGKLIFYFIICSITFAVCFGIYKKFVQPTHSSQQKAQSITNITNNYDCKALLGFGCGGCKSKK